MTWTVDRVLALTQASWVELVAELNGFSEADRAAVVKLLPQCVKAARASGSSRNTVVGAIAAAVGASPARTASAFQIWDSTPWVNNPATGPELLRWLTRNGQEWVTDLVARLLKSSSRMRSHVRLIDELVLACDLPLPTQPRFWELWGRSVGWTLPVLTMLAPGRRWAEHMMAVAQVPNAMLDLFPGTAANQQRLAQRLNKLTAMEPLDRSAMLRALLLPLERGDRVSAQRNALGWITLLDLAPLVAVESAAALRALPSAESSAAKVLIQQLIAADLPAAQLAELAGIVLLRQEKGPKKSMLRALRRLGAAPSELVDAVAAVATSGDVSIAGQALELLAGWGKATPELELEGLWREPSLPPAEPFPAYTPPGIPGDSPQLQDNWTLRHAVDTMGFLDWCVTHAFGLAQDAAPELRSSDALAAAILEAVAGGAEPQRANPVGWLRTTLLEFADGQLSDLVTMFIDQVIKELGRVPCLLSTPTHAGLRVSWQALAERVERYRQAEQPLIPADVALALARMDRGAAPQELAQFQVPINQVELSLADVLQHWIDKDPEPARLTLLPPPAETTYAGGVGIRPQLELTGDEPVTHPMLGIHTAWDQPLLVKGNLCGWESMALPNHPARVAAQVLRANEGYYPPPVDDLQALLLVANPVEAVTSFTVLSTVSDGTPKNREVLAAEALTAWEQGRITSDELVGAWRSEWRKGWPLAPAKVVAFARSIGEAGGLALVWPLLAAVAEELAGEDRIATAASAALEAVARFLPEVPASHRGPLPQVTALAKRSGSSKAILLARSIADQLNDATS